MNAIRTPCDTHLLRRVVIGTSIEHVECFTMTGDRCAFDALPLPRQFWLQDRTIACHLPILTIEICMKGSSCYTLHLHIESRITCGKIEKILTVELINLSIYRTSASPGSCRMKNRIGRVAPEVEAIR